MNKNKKNIFLSHSKLTISVISAVSLLSILLLSEIVLRNFFGFGSPILYDSNPLYGYRPIPNQNQKRFSGAKIRINNLGLRALSDWDENKDNKILFLGDSVTYGGSYISNEELFSTKSIGNMSGYISGNAGVNAWGVDNIYGLIIQKEFFPAKHYITVLIEEDFHRGLTRLHGLPFWCESPKYALKELIFYFYYMQMNHRYKHWHHFSDKTAREKVISIAVKKLKEIDLKLKEKGFTHKIFISPSRSQILNNTPKDELVFDKLKEEKLDVRYISQDLVNLDREQKEKIFYDEVHLTSRGHELYGGLIGEYLKTVIFAKNERISRPEF